MKNIATAISASVLVVASASVSAWSWGPDGGYGYAPAYGYAPYGYGVPVQPPVQPTEEQIKAMQEQQAKAFEYMQNMQRQMAQYYANNPDPIASMERSMFEERNAHMQEMNKLIQEANQDMARNIQGSLSPYPDFGAEPTLPKDLTARKQEMEKQAQEYRKAAEERRAAYMKAQESMPQPPMYGAAEPALPEDVTARKQEMEKQAQEYRKAAEERRAAYMKAAEQRRLDAEKRFEELKLQRSSGPAPVVDVPKVDASKDEAKKS